jgi:hypothetical protein
LAQRSSRKRRKQRQRTTGSSTVTPAAAGGEEAAPREAMARGYARQRAKDDAARAALVPLAPGERPTAVTVGAVVAALAAVANLVALVVGYDSDARRDTMTTLLGVFLLVPMAIGMWRARYWAVLGMQTLLAITVILSSLALMTAADWRATLLAAALIVGSGTLFWFLVKAMARIQMPTRPGAG